MSVMQTTLENPSVTRQGKFFYVFACQVLLLVLFLYLTQPGLPLVLFRLLGAVALVSGVYAVSDKRAQWITALALAIPAVALNIVLALRPNPQIVVPMLIFTILFLALTLVSLLRAVARAERVTHDYFARQWRHCSNDGASPVPFYSRSCEWHYVCRRSRRSSRGPILFREVVSKFRGHCYGEHKYS